MSGLKVVGGYEFNPIPGDGAEQEAGLDNSGGGGNSGGMDTLEPRVAKLEVDVGDIKAILSRMEPMLVRVDAEMKVTLPTLATKIELSEVKMALAEKPSKIYLWAVLAVLVATILAAVAVGVTIAQSLKP